VLRRHFVGGTGEASLSVHFQIPVPDSLDSAAFPGWLARAHAAISSKDVTISSGSVRLVIGIPLPHRVNATSTLMFGLWVTEALIQDGALSRDQKIDEFCFFVSTPDHATPADKLTVAIWNTGYEL
jgi:hypothetical protein